jgi:hypothetical protein
MSFMFWAGDKLKVRTQDELGSQYLEDNLQQDIKRWDP